MRVRRSALMVVWVIVALTAVVGNARPAAACSCIGSSLRDQISTTSEVVIGVPTEVREADFDAPASLRRGFVYRVEVTESRKGVVPAVIEVATGTGGGDCGVTLELGREIGLLLWNDKGQRWVGLCSPPVAPEELRVVDLGAPPVTGTGPPTFAVVGRFGPAWLGLLDAQGRPLGWAVDDDQAADSLATKVVVCDGGRRVVGVRVHGAEQPAIRVTVLATATLTPIWSSDVTEQADERFDTVVDVACAGDEVRLLVHHSQPGGGGTAGPPKRVIRVAGQSSDVTDRDVAEVVVLDPRDGSVLRVDPSGDASGGRTLVREGTGPELTTPIAVLPIDARARMVAGAVDGTGRIAIATNPDIAGGTNDVTSIVTLGPDGSVVGTVDPQIPFLVLRGLGWSNDGRLVVIGEGGVNGVGVVLQVRPDGTDRRVFDLSRRAESFAATAELLVGGASLGSGSGPLVLGPDGQEVPSDLEDLHVAHAAAFPTAPDGRPVVLDASLADRRASAGGIEARVVPVGSPEASGGVAGAGALTDGGVRPPVLVVVGVAAAIAVAVVIAAGFVGVVLVRRRRTL